MRLCLVPGNKVIQSDGLLFSFAVVSIIVYSSKRELSFVSYKSCVCYRADMSKWEVFGKSLLSLIILALNLV